MWGGDGAGGGLGGLGFCRLTASKDVMLITDAVSESWVARVVMKVACAMALNEATEMPIRPTAALTMTEAPAGSGGGGGDEGGCGDGGGE